LTFCAATALVYRMPAVHRPIPKHASIKRFNRQTKNLKSAALVAQKKGKLATSYVNGFYDTYLVGNITIGTPPQTFRVDVDFFHDAELSVIGAKANLSNVRYNLSKRLTFNSSESTTFTSKTGNYSSYGGKGHVGRDVVNLADVSPTLDFGIYDSISYFYIHENLDGALGLSSRSPSGSNNSVGVLEQLATQLDKPVFSVWNNPGRHHDGTAQVTFGAEDTENCHADWVHLPQDGVYNVHLSSVSVNVNGTTKTVGANISMATGMEWQGDLYLPRAAFNYTRDANNAYYNESLQSYVVDCDLSKAVNITFNIGGKSNTSENTTPLILTGADYISYFESSRVCYMTLGWYEVAPDWSWFTEKFWNNHCWSYNIKTKVFGVATSKTALKNPKKW